MKSKHRRSIGTILLLLTLLLLVPVAHRPEVRAVLAQRGGDYDLSWWTVDGGGATFSTGGDYSLGGTIGQPDAGVIAAESYVLQGGFWPGGELMAAPSLLYLPLIVRGG
jgi:hypothetical protein